MGVFFEIIGVAAIPYFVIQMLLRWQENADRKSTVKWQSQKMLEYELRIKELTTEAVEHESALKDLREALHEEMQEGTRLLKENSELEKRIESLQAYIQRLRSQGADVDQEQQIAELEQLLEEEVELKDQIEEEHQAELAELREEIAHRDQRLREFTQRHLSDVEYIRKLQAMIDPTGEQFHRY